MDCSPPVPLSMGFSRQEYWSGLPCPPRGDLPDPGIKPVSLTRPALAGRILTPRATWEALNFFKINNYSFTIFIRMWSSDWLDRSRQMNNGKFKSVWDKRGGEYCKKLLAFFFYHVLLYFLLVIFIWIQAYRNRIVQRNTSIPLTRHTKLLIELQI